MLIHYSVVGRSTAAWTAAAAVLLLINESDRIFPGVISADVAASMHGDAEHVPIAASAEASRVLFEALRDTLAR